MIIYRMDRNYNYYQILGVEKNAPYLEIRKKYLYLVLKYHPDRNRHLSKDKYQENEENFKIITIPFTTLTDVQEREKYDNKLKNSQSSFFYSYHNNNVNFTVSSLLLNIASKFFSNDKIKIGQDFYNTFYNFITTKTEKTSETLNEFKNFVNEKNNNREKEKEKEKEKEYKNSKEKSELVNNMTKESETTKEIYNNKMCINNVPRNEINENVDDSSNSLTKYKNKENQIKKNNDLVYNVNISLEDIYNEVPKELNVARIRLCHLCLGRGYLGFGVNMSLCHICNGLMRLIDKKKFNIDTRESKIIFKNEGNMIINENMKNNMNNEINDLVINIYSKDDSRFERNEYDLIMNYNVSLIELYTEINILFEHLDNKKYLITYKDSEDSLNKIIHKMKIKVSNMGLPRSDPDLGRGDLYIKLNVILPDLSKSEVNKLKNIIFEPNNDSNNYDDTLINKIIIFNT